VLGVGGVLELANERPLLLTLVFEGLAQTGRVLAVWLQRQKLDQLGKGGRAQVADVVVLVAETVHDGHNQENQEGQHDQLEICADVCFIFFFRSKQE